MKKKIILSVLIVAFFGSSSNLSSEEIDYTSLFQKIKQSSSLKAFTEDNAQLIDHSQEFSSLLENGLNSFNILAPYTKENTLKSILAELVYFNFTLRSARSTNIYNKAVRATALIVAPEIGCGAGFVIDKNKGLIITNYHVTSGLKKVLVAFYDDKVDDPAKLKFLPATVIRYSAKRDIAILKLSSIPSNIQNLLMAGNNRPTVGEEVHTIGHPLSLTWTYSRGLITAIRNKFRFGGEEVADVIQIDASISPGNSGGPLLNDSGNVIGMVTFAASGELAQNLNFAISVKDINDILKSRKNEDTSISKTLEKLQGFQLISMSTILKNCKSYKVDIDEDGEFDYISLINKQSKKEDYRLIKNFEIEIESGKTQLVTLLLFDLNDDGEMDVYLIDYDLDNRFDAIMIDTDLDGEPDIIGVDSEGKGVISEAWIL